MAPEFRPGTFEPVITVSPKPDGLTRALHGDKSGLYQVCDDSFRIAYASSSAGGTNTEYTRAAMVGLSRIMAQFLWARQLANQASSLGLSIRCGKALNQEFPLPEPIVKLFNCYGHVVHEDVKYTQLDVERELAWSVLDLLHMTSGTDWDDDAPVVGPQPARDDPARLYVNPTGGIQVNYDESVRSYILRLVTFISASALGPELKLRTIKNVIDAATERDLTAARRFLATVPNLGALPPRGQTPRSPVFEEYLRTALPGHVPNFNDGVLDNGYIVKTIHNLVERLRTVVDELFVPMATVNLPKYEQGSLAQLAETVDDITFTNFPLSLADLTISAAFKVGFVLRRFLRASPELVDQQLRSDLIRKSVRRRA